MFTNVMKIVIFSVLFSGALVGVNGQDEEGAPPCRKFEEIYDTGKELCERMWDGAFKYTTEEDDAYTMWFFDVNNNPNDEISKRLVDKGVFQAQLPLDKCYLEYFHKGEGHEIDNNIHPTEEPETFQECHPWAERSCCHQDTVSSAQKIKEAYGPEWHWDRCGKLSPACERFFVMEACFYECEPNAGVYRKYKDSADDPDPFQGQTVLHSDAEDSDTNAWQMQGMPIKASFCDAWWLACKDDMFCADSGGSYFSCAKAWGGVDAAEDARPYVPGSCKGSCNGKSKTGECGCDEKCEDEGTCCKDREDYCQPEWVNKGPWGSCEGSCNKKPKEGNCYCDKACENKNDCCSDYKDQCVKPDDDVEIFQPVGSCEGHCGKKTKVKGGNCYCDAFCKAKGDCCSDIRDVCAKPGDNCGQSGSC